MKSSRNELEESENNSDSLERFLDGIPSGSLFDKQKQFIAYREFVTGGDENHGRMIHEYIKRQS